MKHANTVCHKYMLHFWISTKKFKEFGLIFTSASSLKCIFSYWFVSVFKVVITTLVFVSASILYLSFLRSQYSFSSMFFTKTGTSELYQYICFLFVVFVEYSFAVIY